MGGDEASSVEGNRDAMGIGGRLTERLQAIRDALLSDLVERDAAVRLALLAALAGEHLLLIGPPGTAKSLVARRLHMAFTDANYFERLLTRFTVPEELFGPLSIRGLEQDRYERLTDAYLPKASIAFLDEIFKANSAILNALLTLLNEREFDNGTRREKTPLIAVVGASNEVPRAKETEGVGDGELDALFDRFLIRLHVPPVSQSGFEALLALRGQRAPEVPAGVRLSGADIQAAQEVAESVEVPEDVVATLKALREWCLAERMPVSDRRWRKILKLLQVSATTNGRDRVSVWDCWLLQYCVGATPEQSAKVYEWYAGRVGASAAMDPAKLTRLVAAWEGRLKLDQDSRSQARDAEGRLLYADKEGTQTAVPRGEVRKRRKGKDLYFAPDGAARPPAQSYYSPQRLDDRTNGGKGYTADELDELMVYERNDWRSIKDWPKRASYLAEPSNWLMVEGDLPASMEPTRHKPVYVDGCLRDLTAVHRHAVAYEAKVAAHCESLAREVANHLWVLPAFAEPATQVLNKTLSDVRLLRDRIEKVQRGFEMLPRENEPPIPDAEGEAPAEA